MAMQLFRIDFHMMENSFCYMERIEKIPEPRQGAPEGPATAASRRRSQSESR
jgi:hypothetical protein